MSAICCDDGRYMMVVLAVLLSVIPSVCFVVYHFKHKEFRYSWLTAFVGMVYLGMVSWAINEFIEIVFYQMTKYHKYMDTLTKLIEIDPDQCSEFNQEDPNIIASVAPRSSQTKNRKSADVHLEQKNPIIKDSNLLFEENGNNALVWFENWSRIEHIACNYFAKRQNIVFAVFTTLFACIVCMLYYYINHNLYNTVTVSIFGGFMYSFMVLPRLLLFAMKISSLESKQIEFIRLQQTYLKHRIVKNKQDAMEAMKTLPVIGNSSSFSRPPRQPFHLNSHIKSNQKPPPQRISANHNAYTMLKSAESAPNNAGKPRGPPANANANSNLKNNVNPRKHLHRRRSSGRKTRSFTPELLDLDVSPKELPPNLDEAKESITATATATDKGKENKLAVGIGIGIGISRRMAEREQSVFQG